MNLAGMKETTPTESKGLTVRWSNEERNEINAEAKLQGIKPTQIVRMAVKQYLDRKKRDRGEQK